MTEIRDGRRLRSVQSRQRIIDAMIELVIEGVIEPTAEQVSARAGVAMRTVFRHFDDMESLYGEIARRMHARVETILDEEITGETWQQTVHNLVNRRLRVYEEMMPMRRAADAMRHRSPFLQEEQARFVTTAREMLRAVLPDAVARDAVRFEALDALLSYELWLRLRRDQKLSAQSAGRVLHRGVDAVLRD